MKFASKVPADLVSVGHISAAYGVHGWVKVHPYSDDAGALLYAKTWWLGKPEGCIDRRKKPGYELNAELSIQQQTSEASSDVNDVEILEAKRHGDVIVARIMGVVGRDAAERLKGSVVQIQRSHFPTLSNNEFYWLDLIGLAVENLQGESLGVVADLIDNGAHPILHVVQVRVESKISDGAAGLNLGSKKSSAEAESTEREYLIPFVEHFVPKVDQVNKKIVVDWGLDY